ncbi:MAG: glycerophosphoryl diester phosphodiesterase [Ilumatobacter sp.]|jgi:glycerophosphoryl diester phosphodiesterase
MGADGVELDVRIASDGRGSNRLVIFHNSLPEAQEEVDVLPSFEEVLDACGDRMMINVEIKNSDNEGGHDPTMAVVAPTIAAMRARGSEWAHRWLLSSFNLATIDRCRLEAPEIPTAFLVYEATDEAIAATVAGGHAAIHPWAVRLTEERVSACHTAGITVNTWTCNEPDRIVELEKMGVDGVVTDVPDVVLDALGRSNDEPVVRPIWGTPA